MHRGPGKSQDGGCRTWRTRLGSYNRQEPCQSTSDAYLTRHNVGARNEGKKVFISSTLSELQFHVRQE
ncbi:hypothetical protein KPH14_007725 [Odynerus spinipes]|uniref:Uncharacterized protein n=1 Tax=Odynerus spinipes TaxID=1348599 RepID=A0AAD9VN88_9HYME|nr:hypothetical protein KPH14_007725 [Odynerus spinipes]